MSALPPQTTTRHVVRAFNTATASENKIHDDEVARQFGFRGGLVPGVDVFAYMVHPAVKRWGIEWFSGGSMAVRFDRPVFDGEVVTVEASPSSGGSLSLRVIGTDGAQRAAGWARTVDGVSTISIDPTPSIPVAPLPEPVPPASERALAPGTVLGSLEMGFHSDRAGEYLDDVREDLALFRFGEVAHPGWLLRSANHVLAASVRLGPWIHLGSELRILAPVRNRDAVTTRARVRDLREHSGHDIVDLEVELCVEETVVMRVNHTAIWRPRQVKGAAG